MNLRGESGSADSDAAASYPQKLKQIIIDGTASRHTCHSVEQKRWSQRWTIQESFIFFSGINFSSSRESILFSTGICSPRKMVEAESCDQIIKEAFLPSL